MKRTDPKYQECWLAKKKSKNSSSTTNHSQRCRRALRFDCSRATSG